jgi:hypothetical protein
LPSLSSSSHHRKGTNRLLFSFFKPPAQPGRRKTRLILSRNGCRRSFRSINRPTGKITLVGWQAGIASLTSTSTSPPIPSLATPISFLLLLLHHHLRPRLLSSLICQRPSPPLIRTHHSSSMTRLSTPRRCSLGTPRHQASINSTISRRLPATRQAI